VIPNVVLERVTTPLGEMVLSRRGDEFSIRVAGVELMHSRNHHSETELGTLACAAVTTVAPRVLIGGLGLGYTLRAALDTLPAGARVDVAELVPEVVRWNRTILGQLANHPLADPRVHVIEEDVAHAIAGGSGYDAIVLDVDNGPDGVASRNDRLYQRRGLEAARAALSPAGLLAVWSAFESRAFTGWLRDAGFDPEVRKLRAHGATHWIWLARRR